jgi:hypothetical protein
VKIVIFEKVGQYCDLTLNKKPAGFFNLAVFLIRELFDDAEYYMEQQAEEASRQACQLAAQYHNSKPLFLLDK